MSRMGAGREWVSGWRFERRRSMVLVVMRTCCGAGWVWGICIVGGRDVRKW